MRESDWQAVRQIFTEGIATGQATFEPEAPSSWEQFDAARLKRHRLVAEAGSGAEGAPGMVVGWAAVAAISTRAAYAGVVEHSIYVGAEARGMGVGKALLKALAQSTEEDGIWTIQSSIFPENHASLQLHLALGFQVVGRRVKIARMAHGPSAGEWRDTLLIERRSSLI